MTGPARPLTPTEARIARLVGIGYDYARVASLLGLRPATVAVYVVRIAGKLPNPDDLKPQTLVLLWAAHERWCEDRRERPDSAA